MSTAVGPRVGIGVVLGLLGILCALEAAPGDPGSIRLAGVGALWWVALAIVLVATLTASLSLGPARATAAPGRDAIVALAAPPVVLVALASRVFTGAADAPALAAVVPVAALVALLAGGPSERQAPSPLGSLVTLLAGALVLWATFLTLGDVAEVVDLPRGLAAGLAVGLALLGGLGRAGGARRALAWSLAIGALAFGLPLVVVGATAGVSPWIAWSETASRPALTFSARSAWVNPGRRFTDATVLAFTEPHRLTALAPGVYRVIEDSDRERVTREWRLSAGDVLTLRPGDRLALEAGAHVRFEAGGRVPGMPVSGAAWARSPDRRRPGGLMSALGTALTLVGGVLGLASALGARAPAPTRPVSGGPLLQLLLVLAAVCWGVYGVHEAPDLGLGRRAAAGLFELPALLFPGPAGRALSAASALGLLVLLVASACALRGGSAPPAAPGWRQTLWAILLPVAAGASVWPREAWPIFLAGCGLAAVSVAPRLAGVGRAAETAGSIVGAVTFAALTGAPGLVPAWAAAVAPHPVLVAGPLAWAVAKAWEVAAAPRG